MNKPLRRLRIEWAAQQIIGDPKGEYCFAADALERIAELERLLPPAPAVPPALRRIEGETLVGADLGGFTILSGQLKWSAIWRSSNIAYATRLSAYRHAAELIRAAGYEPVNVGCNVHSVWCFLEEQS